MRILIAEDDPVLADGLMRSLRDSGYAVVQRLAKYYNNGEDCYLMMKAIY